MITLPLNLRKNGFAYTQLLRGRKSAIYRQEVTPEVSYFEVFLIRSKPERSILGKIIPAKEVFPADEDFGSTAWSCRTYENALKRFNDLETGHD